MTRKKAIEVWVFASAEKVPDTVSRGIMRFTRAVYSHVGILVVYDDGTRIIFHAVENGVCMVDAALFLETHNFPELINITPLMTKTPDQAEGWLEAKLDLPYSFAQYPGVVFSFLATFPLTRRFVANGKVAYFCSEFAAEFIEWSCAIDLWGILDIVTPPQCIGALKKHIEGL